MRRRWFGRHPDDDSGYALPGGWDFYPIEAAKSGEWLRKHDAALAKRLAPHMQRELSALKVRGGPPFDLPTFGAGGGPCKCNGDCGCPKDEAAPTTPSPMRPFPTSTTKAVRHKR